MFVLIFAMACGSSDNDTPSQPAAPNPAPAAPAAPTPAISTATPVPPPPAPAVSAEVTELSVGLLDGGGRGPFAFEPFDFNFAVGEEVKFSFASEAVFHTFTVDDLGIDVSVDGGDTVEFTFTFDTLGTYELTCIPHQALGMVGTITVQ